MDNIMALFVMMSNQYQLPPGLLASVCWVETKHNVQAIHYQDGETNSYGLCQLKLETSRWLGFKGTPQELMRPETNIRYAAIYLKKQLKRYGQVNKAVIAYNQGHANVETTTYQRKVFNNWRFATNDAYPNR